MTERPINDIYSAENAEYMDEEEYVETRRNYATPSRNDIIMSVISYICVAFVTWLIAYFIKDDGHPHSEFRKHHLNQSLILNALALFAGWAGGITGKFLGLIVIILGILGMAYAGRGRIINFPIIGRIKLIK